MKNMILKTQSDYNKIAHEFSEKRRYVTKDILYFKRFLKHEDSVLDLGCGNGRLIDILYPKNEYLGTDNSTGLLKIAQKNYPNYRFLNQNILKLKLNKKYSIVFSLAVLHHFSKKYHQSFIEIIKRHLKKNGVAVLTVWKLNQKQLNGGENVSENECLIPFKNSLGKILVKRYIYQFNLKELKQLFADSGFKIIESGIQKRGRSKNLYLIARL